MKPNRRKLIKISLLFIGIVSTIVGWICTESNIFPLGLILLIGGGFLTLFLGKWMIDDWSYSPNHNKKWAKDWSEYTKKAT